MKLSGIINQRLSRSLTIPQQKYCWGQLMLSGDNGRTQETARLSRSHGAKVQAMGEFRINLHRGGLRTK